MNTISEYIMVPAVDHLRQEVINLLQENNLPVADIGDDKQIFALLNNNEIEGSGGLEFFENCALLRSVSVRSDLRGRGLGKFISHELEEISRQKGITCVYLLTTTARDFFAKQGYRVINREDVPLPIKNSSEFSYSCPSSATVMKKNLD